MIQLVGFFALCLILSAGVQKSEGIYKNGAIQRREWLCTCLLILLLLLFCGLRTSFNDTYNYKLLWRQSVVELSEYWGNTDFALGSNPGFMFINSVIKTLSRNNEQMFFMVYAILTMPPYILFFRRYSPQFTLTIFLFIASGCFFMTLAAMKQVCAMAWGLLAFRYAMEKRYVPFTLIILAASTIHPYILLYLCIPFFCFKPWSRKTYCLLGASALIGLFFNLFAVLTLQFTNMIGEGYSLDIIVGEGVTPLRCAVYLVPIFLSWLYRDILFDEDTPRAMNAVMNLSMVSGVIMFLGLFGDSITMSRLANYYDVFTYVAYAYMLYRLRKERQFITAKFLTVGMIGAYAVYFYYQYFVLSNFMSEYRYVSLSVFLQSLGG